MSKSTIKLNEEDDTQVLYEIIKSQEDYSSGEEISMSEWSSLDTVIQGKQNPKKIMSKMGRYSCGSGEICAKYIGMSSSSLFGHSHHKYPAVTDPGIEPALLEPYPDNIYPEDGQELYKVTCKETNTHLVNLFYRNLFNNEINLSYYGISTMGIRAMAIALRYNKHVRVLNLTDNFIDDDGCFHLGRMLKTNITLEELNLTGCRIGSSGLRRLIKHLPINRTLKELNISRNQLEDEGGELLAKQMDNGVTLERIKLSNNKLGLLTSTALKETLEFKNIITHLDLSWNRFFQIQSTAKLLEVMAFSEVLEELNLAWNALEGKLIAKAIKFILTIPSLKLLDLSNNRFDDKAIEMIVGTLVQAKNLRTLNLSFNPLSPIGACSVIQTLLRPRTKIDNLFLDKVCINKEFMEVLHKIRGMKSRKNLVVTHGEVVGNWSLKGSDPRELILQRAAYLGSARKHAVDIPAYFLKLCHEYTEPVDLKELSRRFESDRIPLDEDLITELTYVFPGPRKAKTTSVNFTAVKEYINRLWPDKKPVEKSTTSLKSKIKIAKSKKTT